MTQENARQFPCARRRNTKVIRINLPKARNFRRCPASPQPKRVLRSPGWPALAGHDSSALSQRRARKLAEERLVIAAEAAQMRESVAQRDSRHIGFSIRPTELVVH